MPLTSPSGKLKLAGIVTVKELSKCAELRIADIYQLLTKVVYKVTTKNIRFLIHILQKVKTMPLIVPSIGLRSTVLRKNRAEIILTTTAQINRSTSSITDSLCLTAMSRRLVILEKM